MLSIMLEEFIQLRFTEWIFVLSTSCVKLLMWDNDVDLCTVCEMMGEESAKCIWRISNLIFDGSSCKVIDWLQFHLLMQETIFMYFSFHFSDDSHISHIFSGRWFVDLVTSKFPKKSFSLFSLVVHFLLCVRKFLLYSISENCLRFFY